MPEVESGQKESESVANPVKRMADLASAGYFDTSRCAETEVTMTPNSLPKLICCLFGHDFSLLALRPGHVQKDVSKPGSCIKVIVGPRLYWHWRCDRCGLTHCSQRFKRYIK